jgi:hypothetical protein
LAYISRQTGFVSIIGISLCDMPMRAGDVRSTVDHDSHGFRLFLSLSYCTSVPVKNVQNHAAELQIAQALCKAGIREHGAGCLKREGVRCLKGDIKQNVRSTFRKREGASLENRFSESAPHLFLKPRPTDALLDIPYIIFILPTASFGPRSLVYDCR